MDVPGGVQARVVADDKGARRVQQSQRPLGDRLQRVGRVKSLTAPDRPGQAGPLVEGWPQVMNSQAGRRGSLGERRDGLERLGNHLIHQVDPRPDPIERPRQGVERPAVAGQRHRVADQSVLPRRDARSQRGQAGGRRSRESGGEWLPSDRVQERRLACRSVPPARWPADWRSRPLRASSRVTAPARQASESRTVDAMAQEPSPNGPCPATK